MTEFVVEEIVAGHNVEAFKSGEDSLDRWLVKQALNNQRGGMSATHVSVAPGDETKTVLGYFTLCPTTIEENPENSKSANRDGYPGYLLAKLARGEAAHGGHGAELATEAFVRALQAAQAAGGRFLVVDPMEKDTEADTQWLRDWYLGLGFKPIDGYSRMFMLMKDVRKAAEQS